MPAPEAWREIASKPLAPCFWVNPLKATVAMVLSAFEELGIAVEPLPGDHFFRVTTPGVSLGNTWLYQTGCIHVQEAVSALSGLLIQAKPHDSIIDLCAAPGNKTAQIAVAMQNTGTVIANDRNPGRLRAFGQIQKRLGLLNVSTTTYDATSFPRLDNQFDRVMADVPCSCEGTFRKNKRDNVLPNRQRSKAMAKTQSAILQKALQLCKPGGSIVYSTCTFAPEENEAVIDWVLKKYPGDFEVVPVSVPGWQVSPGLLHWQGDQYDPQLVNAIRIWPQQNDTGGFFIALLRKKGQLLPLKKQNGPIDPAPDRQKFLSRLIQDFGLPEDIFNACRFDQGNGKGFAAVAADHQPPNALHLESQGLMFMKTKVKFPKWTTAAASLFGHLATKHVVELQHIEQVQQYLTKQSIPWPKDPSLQPGFVVIRYQGVALGLALLWPNDHGFELKSLFKGCGVVA